MAYRVPARCRSGTCRHREEAVPPPPDRADDSGYTSASDEVPCSHLACAPPLALEPPRLEGQEKRFGSTLHIALSTFGGLSVVLGANGMPSPTADLVLASITHFCRHPGPPESPHSTTVMLRDDFYSATWVPGEFLVRVYHLLLSPQGQWAGPARRMHSVSMPAVYFAHHRLWVDGVPVCPAGMACRVLRCLTQVLHRPCTAVVRCLTPGRRHWGFQEALTFEAAASDRALARFALKQ